MIQANSMSRRSEGEAPFLRHTLNALLLCLVAVHHLQAVDLTKLKPQGYVSDFANVLDSTDRAQLERYCTQVEQATGAQLAIVTIQSLDGDPIEDDANALYRQWGIGKKGKDEGALLLLSVGDRKSRLEVGYGLEPIVPDGFSGSVLREMRPSLREGNYGQALIAGTAHIGQTIAQAKGVTIERTLPRRSAPLAPRSRGIPWPLVIVGIFILLSLLSRGGRGGGGGGGFLTGMILGNLLNSGSRGGSSWGGGGFGGGDSGGGGFGGFGGGDSGGGGASSDW